MLPSMNNLLYRSIVPGTLTYTLTRGQIFSLYFWLALRRYVLVISILFFAGISAVIALFLLGTINEGLLIYLVVSLSLLDALPLLAIFIYARRKSLKPDSPPGGEIRMEWDSLSLCIRAGAHIFVQPWGDVVWKNLASNDFLFHFPDSNLVFVPATAPPEVLEALRSGLRKV